MIHQIIQLLVHGAFLKSAFKSYFGYWDATMDPMTNKI